MAYLDTIDKLLEATQPLGSRGFRITAREIDPKTVVMDCEGTVLNDKGVDLLDRMAAQAMDAGAVNLVFNMEALSIRPHVRPPYLGALIHIFSRANRSGGSVSLVQPNAMGDLLERTKMRSVFGIHETEQQALAAMAPARAL
ncbi:MAG TPA: hypothetical protein VL625_09740 [Patescibacteria group bacterium]|nr:hypothetical protein [Patescibacteria group bacterium]